MNTARLFRVRLGIVALGLTGFAAHGAAPVYDSEKLRSMVDLPTLSFDMGFTVETRLGFTFCGEPMDLARCRPVNVQIEELRKEISGGPGDAARYSRLAELYGDRNDEAEAKAAWKKSADLFREQIQNKPKDGWLRAQLGKAMAGFGERDAAGERLREAVTISPEDWRCWKSLADFTFKQAWFAVGLTNANPELNPAPQPAPISASSLSPERVAKARELRREAGKFYDKAVACAPAELGAYEARICYRWAMEPILKARIGDEPPKDSLDPLRESLPDLKKAAEVATNNPYPVAVAAFVQAVTSVPKDASLDVQATGFWPALPDDARAYLSRAIARLEKLGGNSDTNIAAGALAALGGLQAMVRRDLPAAEENLRRAGKLRPASEAPGELLSLVFLQSARWQDLAKLREERVKVNDTVRNRLLLAKAYSKAGMSGEVLKEVQAAVKLSPNDLLAHTAMAALRLKEAKDEQSLQEVGQMMARVKQTLFDKAPQNQQMAFEYVHGLYFALAGNREEAGNHFRRLREADPEEKKYRDACDALGF